MNQIVDLSLQRILVEDSLQKSSVLDEDHIVPEWKVDGVTIERVIRVIIGRREGGEVKLGDDQT